MRSPLVFLFILLVALCYGQDDEPRSKSLWQRMVSDPVKQTYRRLTRWHFEGRTRLNKNGRIPSLDEISSDPHWTLLPPAMSVFHDNGVGQAELKFVSDDGREAVFDGDTKELLMNPKFMPTFNYVNPMKTSEVNSVQSAAAFVGRNVGHFFADVIPYAVGGNVRGKDDVKEARFERLQERIFFVRIESGDTLSGIAAANGVTLRQILQWNPQFRRNPDLILVGQRVRMVRAAAAKKTTPPPTPPSSSTLDNEVITSQIQQQQDSNSVEESESSSSSSESSSSNVVIVQPGDSLSVIAARHGVSLRQVLAWNPKYQRNPDLIRPGETVTIMG